MISLNALALIFTVHWIADFIMQDEQWALNKSKDNTVLLKHTITYSATWILPVLLYTRSIVGTLLFVIVTFVIHTTQDYLTSRATSAKFAKKETGSAIPNLGAFTYIGYDQLLHYLQLVIFWYLIFT